MELNRNTDVGVQVATFQDVTDADIGENARISFQEIRGGELTNSLDIDQQSGQIFTTK